MLSCTCRHVPPLGAGLVVSYGLTQDPEALLSSVERAQCSTITYARRSARFLAIYWAAAAMRGVSEIQYSPGVVHRDLLATSNGPPRIE